GLDEAGEFGASHSGRRLLIEYEKDSQNFCSWRKSIGIWSGLFNRRDLITLTTSASMTGLGKVTRDRFASTSKRDSIIRTSWRAFWRTTTNLAQLRQFRRAFTKQLPS